VPDLPPNPALELRHVSLSFDEKKVLSDVSFEVPKGGTLILLGVAASGKSVLLKLILGLFKPDEGEILVDGTNLVPLAENQLEPFRRRMGIVFQEGALFDSLSVFENVAYRLHEEGKADDEFILRRVREVLGFVELDQAIDKMPAELSGGMRRRVAIARAIVSEPSIMLYDLPTAGLDPVTSHTIDVLLAKLRDTGNVTSIVVTHRLQDAFVLSNFKYSAEKRDLIPIPSNGHSNSNHATRFLILREGSVYFQGSEQEFATSRDPYLQRFLS
jgi:phospholipid/cholesterol/gamma-HCH transport system ATP-binding protein